MRRKVLGLVIGGLVAAGLTIGTAQIAESATGKAKGPDPALTLRKQTVKVKGGIDAPAPPRPLGEQLQMDPDPASNPVEEGKKATKRKAQK